MAETALIALDWGTTSVRAYRIGQGGEIGDAVSAPLGILKVPDSDFETAFDRIVGPWLADATAVPLLASGMIGSRQGWIETPYRPCPAGAEDLARGLAEVWTRGGHVLRIVPGVSYVSADGVPDVMRGEETQILGDPDFDAADMRVYLLPGTHSKWAVVGNGRIVWFATFLTGELFDLLCRHSILGRLMTGEDHDAAAFARGLDYARQGRAEGLLGTGLLGKLFSARSLALFGRLPETGTRSYLSGLLIGTEVGEALARIAAGWPDVAGPVTIIGNARLAGLYAESLRASGSACVLREESLAATGMFRLAVAAGLLEER